MKLRHLLLCAALYLSCLTLRAQGPLGYLWTWNSGSGLFQGSFETPADYLTGSIEVGNGLYNLNFTSPDRTWSANANLSGDQTLFTYYGTNSFSITVYDPSGEELQANPTAMEAEINNQILFSESGSWTITQIPEPSAVALVALGFGGFFIRRKMIHSV